MPKKMEVSDLLLKLEEQGKGFKYVSNFVNAKTPCKFICGNCGGEVIATPSKILSKNRIGCSNCANSIRMPSIKKGYKYSVDKLEDKFRQKLLERFPNKEFEYIEGYVDRSTKCIFKCNSCGNNKFLCTPSTMLSTRKSNTCDRCKDPNASSKESGEINFKQRLAHGYTILDKYTSNKEPLKIRHEKCDSVFMYIPNHINMVPSGKICPYCKSENLSINSSIVNRFLRVRKIDYEVEKSFDGLKFRRLLKLDFYIPEYKIAIEVDGKHHSEEDSLYKSRDTKERDLIKNKFCKENGITLYRIRHDHDPFKAMYEILELNQGSEYLIN